MTHVSDRLNNPNVSYNKLKMCSNKTVLPHALGKTAPGLGYYGPSPIYSNIRFNRSNGIKTMCFIHYLFKPSLTTTIVITHREQKYSPLRITHRELH